MKRIAILVLIFFACFVLVKAGQFNPAFIVNQGGYVVIGKTMAKNLLNPEDSKKDRQDLGKIKEQETVYKKTGNLYMGEESKKKINQEFPMFTKDETGVVTLSGEGRLIDSDFSTRQLYSQLTISDGEAFNHDGSKAATRVFYFLQSENGTFVNTKSIRVVTGTSTYEIKANSPLNFQKDALAYYTITNGNSVYTSGSDVDASTKVYLDGKVYDYLDLLEKLGILGSTSLPAEKEDDKDTETEQKEEVAEKTPTEEEGEGEGESGEGKPYVKLENMYTGVYSLNIEMNIFDGDNKISKGVILEVNDKKNNMILRRVITSSGEMKIMSLEPGETYKIDVYYSYTDKEDKEKIVSLADKVPLTMKKLSELPKNELTYGYGEIKNDRIQITDIVMTSELENEGLVAAQKATIEVQGGTGYAISPAQLKNLKNGETFNFETPGTLESNKQIRFQIYLNDRFGNRIKIGEEGETRTAKAKPTADLITKVNQVAKTELEIKFNNKDNVELKNVSLKLTDKNGKTLKEKVLTQNEIVTYKDLPPNIYVKGEIFATYDIDDGKGESTDVVIAETTFYTVPITALGLVYLQSEISDITHETADLKISIPEGFTDPRRLALMTNMKITLEEKKSFADPTWEKEYSRAEIEELIDGEIKTIKLEGLSSQTEYILKVTDQLSFGALVETYEGRLSQNEFKTYKTPAKVMIRNDFATSNHIEFEAKIVDPEDTIVSENTVVEVRDNSGKLVAAHGIQQDGDYEPFNVSKLKEDQTYFFNFMCSEYNKGYNATTIESPKIIYTATFETNLGVSGSAKLQSLTTISGNSTHFNANILINGKDTNSRTQDGIFYLDVYDGNQLLETRKYEVNNLYISNLRDTIRLPRNKSIRLDLRVKVSTFDLILDTEDFNTDRVIVGISNADEFNKIVRSNNASSKYIVLGDIDLRTIVNSAGTPNYNAFNLRGEIDFKGFSLYHHYSESSSAGVFAYSSGKIKNVDFHYEISNTSLAMASNKKGGLVSVHEGNGEITNIICTLDASVEGPRIEQGLIVWQNKAKISNFVVNFKKPLTGSEKLGGVAAQNNGTIANGYVYGAGVQYNSPNNASFFRMSGGVVGDNFATVRNVYSLASTHANERGTAVGSVIGRSQGSSQNTYGVSNDYAQYRASGPVIGEGESSRTLRNFYVSENTHTNRLNTKTSPLSLWDTKFQNQQLNSNNQFDVDSLNTLGYYPQVIMSDDMPAQEFNLLPLMHNIDIVDITNSKVLEKEATSAKIEVTVNNPENFQITGMSMDGGLNVEVLQGEQINHGKSSTVIIEIKEPSSFTDRYSFTRIEWTSVTGSTFGRNFDAYERVLDVSFFKPIRTPQEFNNIRTNHGQNYILMNDINFENTNLFNLGNFFTGVLDGNGYTLKNIKTYGTVNSVIVRDMNGIIRNLNVDGVEGDYNNCSIFSVRHATGRTLFDNVHVKNAHIRAMGGKVSLIFNRSNAGGTVRNSSVSDSSIVAPANSTVGDIGGIAANGHAMEITNSFVRNLTIDTSAAGKHINVGGITGYMQDMTLRNVYAADCEFITANSNVGAIVGSNNIATNTNVINGYSNSQVTSSSATIMAVKGYDGSRGTVDNFLSLGDLYSNFDTVDPAKITMHRITSSPKAEWNNYGYEGQTFNGVASTDTKGVTDLVTYQDLFKRETYEDKVDMGNQFSYEGAERGILPKLRHAETGKLLVNQEDVSVKVPEDISYKSVIVTPKDDQETTAKIQITLNNPGNLKVEKANFDFLEATTDPVINTGNGVTTIHMTVRATRAITGYWLESIDYIKNGEARKFEKKSKINLTFYNYIRSASDWNNIRSTVAENYYITDDLDFAMPQGGSAINQKMNIKVATMVGGPVLYEEGGETKQRRPIIKNLDYNSTSSQLNQGLIGIVEKELKNLDFQNITIGYSHNGTATSGLIGYIDTRSKLSSVRFNNITINGSDNTDGLGIFGRVIGATLNVETIKDITITGRDWIGGIVGDGAATTLTGTIENINVTGRDYVGGIVGRHPKAITGATISNVNIKGRNFLGGVTGIGGTVTNVTANNVSVTGSYGVGGIGGENSTVKGTAVTGATIKGSNYSGGIVGKNGYVDNSKVVSSEITGTDWVGGISGSALHNGVSYCNVEDSVIKGVTLVGGAAGYAAGSNGRINVLRTRVEGKGEITTNAAGVMTSAKGRIGGVIGESQSSLNDVAIVDSEVIGTTQGARDVGGIVGYSYKNTTNQVLYSVGTKVESLGSYVGGICGTMVDAPAYQRMYVVDNPTTGKQATVDGVQNVGGIIGVSIHGKVHYVYSGADVTGVSRVGGIIGRVEGALSSTRELKQAFTMGGTVTATGSLGDAGGIIGWSDSGANYGAFSGILAGSQVKSTGPAVSLIGNMTNAASMSNITGAFVHNLMKINGVTVDLVPGEVTGTTLVSSEEIANEALYTRMGFWSSVGNYSWKLDPNLSNNKMPTISYGEGEYGFQGGGIPIPQSVTNRMASMRAMAPLDMIGVDESFPSVYAYTVEGDKVNLEFSTAKEASKVVANISSGNDEIKDIQVNGRVITVSYDFKYPIEINMQSGDKKRKVSIDPKSINRVADSYNGSLYTVDNNGIKVNKTTVVKGEFLNIKNGQAVSQNGQVYSVGGSLVKTLDKSIALEEKILPLFTFNHKGSEIHTYGNRASVRTGDSVNYRAMQLFAKGDTLYAIDGAMNTVKDSVIIDSNNDKKYIVALSTNGEIINLGDEINLGDKFENENIKYFTDNFDGEEGQVLVVYNDGRVVKLNYQTGTTEELGVNEDAVETETFGELLKEQIASLFSFEKQEQPAPASYRMARTLMSKLIDEPYEESGAKDELDYVTGDVKTEKTAKDTDSKGAKDQEEAGYVAYYNSDLEKHEIYKEKAILTGSSLGISENQVIGSSEELKKKYYDQNAKAFSESTAAFDPVVIYTIIIVLIGSAVLYLGVDICYLRRRRQAKSKR